MNGLAEKEKLDNSLRRMINVCEMVDYLKQKSITFIKMTEKDAENYLLNNNNYYNLTAYKNNFEKYTGGELDK